MFSNSCRTSVLIKKTILKMLPLNAFLVPYYEDPFFVKPNGELLIWNEIIKIFE